MKSSHHAAFRLQAIDLAGLEGNRAAARKLGVHEYTVGRWRRKAFHQHKRRWHEPENTLPKLLCRWGLYLGAPYRL